MRATRVKPAGKHYKSERGSEAIPPWVEHHSALRQANDIGRAIFSFAQSNAPQVARIISIYAAAVDTDRQITMNPTVQAHIDYGNELITLVRGLPISTLGFRLVGFENSSGQHADLSVVRAALQLPPDTPTRPLKARNPKAASSARLVGLEVVRTTSNGRVVVDEPFFVTMILAAAVEAWRFV